MRHRRTIKEIVFKYLEFNYYGGVLGLAELIHDDHKNLRLCHITRVVCKLYDDDIIKDNLKYNFLYLDNPNRDR